MPRHPPAIQLAGQIRGHKRYPVMIFAHPHRHPLVPVGRLCSGGGRRLGRLSTLGMTCLTRDDCSDACTTCRGECGACDDCDACGGVGGGIMMGGIETRLK